MSKSKISWTDEVWNPIRGCTPISPGCENCYAARMAHRFSSDGGKYEGLTRSSNSGPVWTGEVVFDHSMLERPYHWRRKRLVFVNSMSDLFHCKVPDGFIREVVMVMEQNPDHLFQVLTKRPERMFRLLQEFRDRGTTIPENVWWGATIEDADRLHRMDALWSLHIAGHKTFVSLEPLIGAIPITEMHRLCRSVDWVIVGGESGPKARPMHPGWVREIRDVCLENKTPFMFKQWGEWGPDSNGSSPQTAEVKWSPQTVIATGLHESAWMYRVGKKAAGKVLDGEVFDWRPTP